MLLMTDLLGYHFKYIQLYIVTLDKSKPRYKPELFKIPKNPPDNICNVQFSNKGIKLIVFLLAF